MGGNFIDKKKTGALIRDARSRKNYTQSELGDLLGVSNKAVSRWENGESFPDVGILENLATVLDVRIQDIVTGDTETNDDAVLTDVVREAKLQQKNTKRKLIKSALQILPFVCLVIAGLLAFGYSHISFAYNAVLTYSLLMLVTFVSILLAYRANNIVCKAKNNIFCKCSKIIAVLTFFWGFLLTWYAFIAVSNGHTPFGLKASSVGMFVSWQLLAVFMVNFMLLVLEALRFKRYDEAVHWGWYVSVAALYLVSMYGDLLHNLSSAQEAVKGLVGRTAVVVIFGDYEKKSVNSNFYDI